MTYQLIRGNAMSLPLADESVDLVVTSPPYFALRSYTDGGEHYEGQIGSEATPQEFLEALWAWTTECRRVLKPSGSLWVNLGDKYVSGTSSARSNITAPEGYGNGKNFAPTDRRLSEADAGGIRTKSLMLLPQRYAIGCIDDLNLICRAEVIWSKPNGLPESVTDRVRRSHEQWFHFTKEPRYFSAVDEIREAHTATVTGRDVDGWRPGPSGMNRSTEVGRTHDDGSPLRDFALSALGKLPGSVWTVPTEPLRVPDHLGVDHFAAFPSEWPRRLILGWSPSGVCVECGEGRRPVVAKDQGRLAVFADQQAAKRVRDEGPDNWQRSTLGTPAADRQTTITGYACACTTPDAPTRPAVVLDPFAGTGTVPAVAHALGRHGIGIDLSADYLRLAEWRCNDPALRAKVLGVDKPKPVIEGQTSLFDEVA